MKDIWGSRLWRRSLGATKMTAIISGIFPHEDSTRTNVQKHGLYWTKNARDERTQLQTSPLGPRPPLSSRKHRRRRATFVGGLRLWRGAQRCGLARSEADSWFRLPPPGAQRMRRAGASEIQLPADLPGTQPGGHGGVWTVCGSCGLNSRAGRPLPEVCLRRWAGLARRPRPGVGVGSPRTVPAAWSLVRRALAFPE